MAETPQDPRAAALDGRELDRLCGRMTFAPREELRRKGNHYTDMYVILDGSVEIRLEPGTSPIVIGPGSPVGEIGFLKGCRTTATAVAREATTALVLDDETLWKVHREAPHLAVVLLRTLADMADERLSMNDELATALDLDRAPAVEVLLCRNEEMFEDAARMRYRVYCEELGRSSPYADHERKVIRDNLDDFGHTFVAVDEGRVIGTLRANLPTEGDLGVLEELYGMSASPNHPERTMICTKLIVEKTRRGGPASMDLIAAMASFALKADIHECFIDCIPKLIPLYRRLGFEVSGESFFHYENGPSVPLMMDITQHAERLSRGIGR